MFSSYTFLDLAQQARFTNVIEYSVAQTNLKFVDIKHDNKIQKYESATSPPSTLKGRGQVKIYLKLTQIFRHYFPFVVTTFLNYYIFILEKK